MSVKIRNLSEDPVTIRLNRGTSVHIAPLSESPECNVSDVEGSEFIKKLERQNKIKIYTPVTATSKATARSIPEEKKTDSSSDNHNKQEKIKK